MAPSLASAWPSDCTVKASTTAPRLRRASSSWYVAYSSNRTGIDVEVDVVAAGRRELVDAIMPKYWPRSAASIPFKPSSSVISSAFSTSSSSGGGSRRRPLSGRRGRPSGPRRDATVPTAHVTRIPSVTKRRATRVTAPPSRSRSFRLRPLSNRITPTEIDTTAETTASPRLGSSAPIAPAPEAQRQQKQDRRQLQHLGDQGSRSREHDDQPDLEQGPGSLSGERELAMKLDHRVVSRPVEGLSSGDPDDALMTR